VRLLDEGWIGADERVVLFNTGTALKHVHLWRNGTHKRA
jgi:hypothetical protein